MDRFAALVLAPPPAQLRLAQVHIEAACAVVNLDRKYYAKSWKYLWCIFQFHLQSQNSWILSIVSIPSFDFMRRWGSLKETNFNMRCEVKAMFPLDTCWALGSKSTTSTSRDILNVSRLQQTGERSVAIRLWSPVFGHKVMGGSCSVWIRWKWVANTVCVCVLLLVDWVQCAI